MFGNLSTKNNKLGGYITLYGLEDWWHDVFSDEERKHIVETFQPIGAPKDILAAGDLRPSDNRALNLLASLAGWFDNPRDRSIAYKIISKAEEYVSSEKNVLDLHFFYPAKMRLFYKEREDPAALKKATSACFEQIKIADRAADAFRNEFDDDVLPSHEGYTKLCIILEKEGKHEEAIKLAKEAKARGWAGDWDKRIERCKKKLEK